MGKLQTRNSIFALKEEVTEGVPVLPTLTTDFLAVQEGFDIDPSIDEIENNEIQSSIGMTKNALGLENPTATLDHYLRHSGVEGQSPNYRLLMLSCLGQENVQSTERTTAAASTVSVVKLAAGGSDYARGRAILVKDGVNGYSIRNIASVATEDLTLAQELASAPASGVTCGKFVNFTPVDSDHPTLSLWGYRANKGAIELLPGSRVTEMSIDIPAADNINCSYSLDGLEYYYDPMTVTASNKYIDFTDSLAATLVASVAEKTYKYPQDLRAALEVAMNGAGGADTFAVTYNGKTGAFTIASDNATFSILWKTGAHGADNADDHIGTLLGFDDSADDTAQSNVADNLQSWVSAITPVYDNSDPLAAKNHEAIFGTSSDIVCQDLQSLSMSISNTKTDILSICAASGKSGTQFTARETSIDLVGYLDQGESENFKRFIENEEIVFTYNGGVKSGGNWVAGKCFNLHMPTARISSFKLGDGDGIVTLEMTLQGYVKAGQPEVYINFL